jgi:hypothetical protein
VMTRKNVNSVLLSMALLCLAYTPAYAETLYYDEAVYSGEVVNGKPHGQGTMEYTAGHKYVGEWFLGTRKGQGTYTWPDGQKYVGEYLNDKQGMESG